MIQMQNALFLAQNAVFGLCLILSIAALGLAGHWISASSPEIFTFEALGLAAGLVSMICLGVFLGVGLLRKNAIFTMIGVQLPVLVIISALFLAEGVVSNDTITLNFPLGCNFDLFPIQTQFCNQLLALRGVSFAIFAFLLVYWLPLLLMVVIEFTRGRNTLKSDIRDVSFSKDTQVQGAAMANLVLRETGIGAPSQGAHHGQVPYQQYQVGQPQ